MNLKNIKLNESPEKNTYLALCLQLRANSDALFLTHLKEETQKQSDTLL